MRLYIIRHADPDYANDTITARGHEEALALADRLASVQIDHLYSSPMGRAQATASYTARQKGMTPTILDWTAELGHWQIEQPHDGGERVCVWDVHPHRVRACEPLPTDRDWHSLAPFDKPIFREEFDELVRRSDDLLASHGYVRDGGVYRIEQANRDALAVFCHGGFGLTWLAHLLGVPLPLMWSSFFISPSSVTTILFDERNDEVAVPRCIGMADVSHLHTAGLLDGQTPGGIKANYW
ncbi:MAG: histidine phosphatase family protein [Phycisphaeraceae bacterium]